MTALEYRENVAPIKVHNCKICPFSSTSLSLMTNHVKTHRSTLPHFSCENSPLEIYSCKHCNVQTNLTSLMKNHIAKHHSPHPPNAPKPQEETTIKCYICEQYGFETYFLLKWWQHTEECRTNAKHETPWHHCKNCSNKSSN